MRSFDILGSKGAMLGPLSENETHAPPGVPRVLGAFIVKIRDSKSQYDHDQYVVLSINPFSSLHP